MPKRPKIEAIPAELVVAGEPIRVPAEIVPTNAAKLQKAIVRLVEQKVAEAMKGEDSIFEPWFQPQDMNREIRRHQTVAEIQKWKHYFEKWGCVCCEDRKRPHASLGMCSACRDRTTMRLRRILKEHAPPPGEFEASFTDTVALARAALAPSAKLLRKARVR